MRIRRRPPLPSLSSPAPPLQTPDPSLFHPQPPHKGEATKEKGVGEEGEGEGEGLHQDGDLQIESHGWGMDPINGDPAPSGAGHPTTGRRQERSTPPFFASPHPTLNHGQVNPLPPPLFSTALLFYFFPSIRSPSCFFVAWWVQCRD